ncbi:MAG: restriction endonuclease [Phycisphaera sp.]|nr:MAG: restriction endonuclease [Phycisphaera sp.]
MPRYRRDDEGIDWEEMFQLFRHAPWWVGPAFAAGVLVLFFGVIPLLITAIGTTSEMAGPMAKLIRSVVPMIGAVFAMGILIVWGFAMVAKPFDRKRLDRQRGPETIDNLTWQQFELLLAEAMRRRGYAVERSGGHGPDGGVDLRLDRHGEKTLVQCKHWKATRVGVGPVRELRGVVAAEGAQRGMLVASGSFTSEARTFAAASGVELIDGKTLWPMIRAVQKVPASDAPSVPTAPAVGAVPACPRCGAAMERRVARRGPNTGKAFFGCSSYPQCKATLAIAESS